MNSKKVLFISLILIFLMSVQLYAADEWKSIGLEDQNVNCLLFDYLLYGGSNLLAGTDKSLFFYHQNLEDWLEYPELPKLPVNDIKLACKGRIITAIGNGLSWSDAVFGGYDELDGPPYYVFRRIEYLGLPQSCAVKGENGDTVYVGAFNKIYMTIFEDTAYGELQIIKAPENCFGTKKPKCAAMEIYPDFKELVAGGYDEDTISPEQGHFLWQRGDSMHTFGEINVSAMSVPNSTFGEIYIGTIDKGIYYYTGAMSSPPVKILSSPNNEPVNDIIVIPGQRLLNDTIYVACKSGVYLCKITENDTTWKELGDLPAEPNCIAIYKKLNAPDVLYAGTSKGVYFFDTSSVPIYNKPKSRNTAKNVFIKNTKSGSIIIDFYIKNGGNLSINLLNISGKTLVPGSNRYFPKGRHSIQLNTKRLSQKTFSNGIYILKLEKHRDVSFEKVIFMRR